MKLARNPTKPTPTATLLLEMHHCKNPVTRSVLAQIIGGRIDRKLKTKDHPEK